MEMKQRVRANLTCGFESIIAGNPPLHDVFEQTLLVGLYPLSHFSGLSNCLAGFRTKMGELIRLNWIVMRYARYGE